MKNNHLILVESWRKNLESRKNRGFSSIISPPKMCAFENGCFNVNLSEASSEVITLCPFSKVKSSFCTIRWLRSTQWRNDDIDWLFDVPVCYLHLSRCLPALPDWRVIPAFCLPWVHTLGLLYSWRTFEAKEDLNVLNLNVRLIVSSLGLKWTLLFLF